VLQDNSKSKKGKVGGPKDLGIEKTRGNSSQQGNRDLEESKSREKSKKFQKYKNDGSSNREGLMFLANNYQMSNEKGTNPGSQNNFDYYESESTEELFKPTPREMNSFNFNEKGKEIYINQ
jgi:hypothetical protein